MKTKSKANSKRTWDESVLKHGLRAQIQLIDDMEALIVGKRWQSEGKEVRLKGSGFNLFFEAEVEVCNQMLSQLRMMRKSFLYDLDRSLPRRR